MNPPRQDFLVERVCGVWKVLKYCITKAERLYLEGRKVRRYEGRPFTLKGLFSNCQSLPSCSDITSSCKTQVSGAAATLPLAIRRGNKKLFPLLGRGIKGEGLFSCQEGRLKLIK